MATPYLGQLVAVSPDTELDQSYITVILDPDGSRQIHRSSFTLPGETWATLVESFERVLPDNPVVLWGPASGPGAAELDSALGMAVRSGWYLPYPPADGIPTFPVEDSPNQIPHQQDFLNHACTFSHELLTDFHPAAPRLRQVDSWNAVPDLDLDVDSIQRNRIGMRYYRGVLGYFYDSVVRFASHPNNPDELGQFETDWRTELEKMQDLDRYVCGTCQDEDGGSRLRDFIHHLNISAWDSVLDEVIASGSGSSLIYTARLPRIDRSNPDDLIPHMRKNVRTWVSNVASVDGGWKSMMRDFDYSVKRYDRDPSVRMPSGRLVA